MSAIGPGDFVECIDKAAPARALGRPFRVVEIVDGDVCLDCGDTAPGVELDHLSCAGNVYCCGCQVRPIYRPKSEIIQSLKQPAPSVREPEHA
jgi:hypothetical protein